MRRGRFSTVVLGAGMVVLALWGPQAVRADGRCTRYLAEVLDLPSITSVDVSPDRTRLYARINYGPDDGGFRVIDLTTGNYDVIADYHIPGVPWDGWVSWDHQHLWMTRYYGGYVSALNLVESDPNNLVFDCDLSVGSWTTGLAFDSLRKHLYVAEGSPGPCTADGSIVKIDTTRTTCGDDCVVAGRVDLDGEPGYCIQVGFGDQYVFAIGRCSGIEAFYKIRTSDMQIVDLPVPLPGIGDAGFSLSPDGSTAYVPDATANQIHVIDTASMTEIEQWPLPFSPTSFWVSPDGTHALVLTLEPLIRVFDMSQRAVYQYVTVERIGAAPHRKRNLPYWDCASHTVYVPMIGELGPQGEYEGGVVVLKETTCPGDLDCDGYVGLADLAILLANYDGTPCP